MIIQAQEKEIAKKEMNGPQRTACLAKGYIHSKFARCLTATDSDYGVQPYRRTDGMTICNS